MENWKKILLKAAGFGGGFAVFGAIILGTITWWVSRPTSWKTNAVTAKYSTLTARQTNDVVQMDFVYSLTNHTKNDYSLPPFVAGSLMRRLPESDSVEKLDDVTWDYDVKIPPKQTVDIKFTVSYKLSDFNMTADEINGPGTNGEEVPPKFVEFINRRMKEANGLRFYDYSSKYQIDMPSGWQNAK